MQSFRTRMNSALRRPSWTGTGNGSAGSGSDSSRPSSPAPNRKLTSEKRRKRVSFGTVPVVRTSTIDAAEQSDSPVAIKNDEQQLLDRAVTEEPTEVVDPAVVEAKVTDQAGEETAVVEHVVGEPAAEVHEVEQELKDVVKGEQEDVTVEGSMVIIPPHGEIHAEELQQFPEAPAMPIPAPYQPGEAGSSEVTQPLYSMPEPPIMAVAESQIYSPYYPSSDRPRHDQPDGHFEIVRVVTPARPTSFISVGESPGFPEPSPYKDYSVPILQPEIIMPKPSFLSQHGKKGDRDIEMHPLLDWTHKDDVNYDADEEESRPLLSSSLMSATEHIGQHLYSDSIQKPTVPLDSKKKSGVSTPTFRSLGWTEHVLPDNSSYFTLHVSAPSKALSKASTSLPSPAPSLESAMMIVADYNLHDLIVLRRICDAMKDIVKSDSTFAGFSTDGANWELWIKQPTLNDDQSQTIPHAWINHYRRSISKSPSTSAKPAEDSDATTLVDGPEENEREKLVRALEYWSYIEKHPAHGVLVAGAKREALDGLTWSFADRLLQNDPSISSAFSQDECQSLLRLVEGIDTTSVHPGRLTSNRIIASIITRITQYRINCLDKAQEAALQKGESSLILADKKGQPTRMAFPFRRAILGFTSAILCWGIPYLFLDDPSADPDPISRFRPLQPHQIGGNPSSMYYSFEDTISAVERRTNALLYGAGVGLTAAILLGSTTTLLTMRPPLDTPARTAGFVALLCAGASLAASIISIARMSRLPMLTPFSTSPPSSNSYFPGVRRDSESLVVLNIRPIRRALPLVLLAYAAVALCVSVLLHTFGKRVV